MLNLGVTGFTRDREKLLVRFKVGSVGESGSLMDDANELALYELTTLFILLSSMIEFPREVPREFPRDPMLATAGAGTFGTSFLERDRVRRSGDPVEIALGSSTGSSSR